MPRRRKKGQQTNQAPIRKRAIKANGVVACRACPPAIITALEALMRENEKVKNESLRKLVVNYKEAAKLRRLRYY